MTKQNAGTFEEISKRFDNRVADCDAIIERIEQTLLDNRRKPCINCGSTGKSQSTFDKLCDQCTPDHCCVCGKMVGLKQVGSYSLCREHLKQERRES